MLSSFGRWFKGFFFFPYFSLMDMFHRISDVLRYYIGSGPGPKEFRKTDLALTRTYLLRNPYAMCRRHFFSKAFPSAELNQVQTVYGETLLMTLELINAKLRINQYDLIMDLGSGRGRNCFFWHAYTQAQVVGVELNPDFVNLANSIRDRFQLQRLEFVHDNIFDADLSQATILYFYGVAFSEQATLGLIEKFSQLSPGIVILSVGFSLNDYYDAPIFVELESFEVFFVWGKTRIHVMQTKPQIMTD